MAASLSLRYSAPRTAARPKRAYEKNEKATCVSNQKVFSTGGRGKLCGFASIEKSIKQTVSAVAEFRNLSLFFRLKEAGMAKSMNEVERKNSVS